MVFNLSFYWKTVLVIHSCCFSAHSSIIMRPLSLQLPTPCFPSTHFHISDYLPTLAMKSPRMTFLSFAGTFRRRLLKYVYKYSSPAGSAWRVGAYTLNIVNAKWQTHGDGAVGVTDWQVCHLCSYGVPDHVPNT